MLKITGVILCVAGSAGYGWVQIQNWKRILHEIKIWVMLFQKIKSCFLYQKETLENGCIRIGEKEDSGQGSVLVSIGKRACKERQKEFCSIWQEEIGIWCKRNGMPPKTEQLLMQFPEYMKDADEQLQMELFSIYIEEMHAEEKLMEQRIREQQKPVMAVSLVVGLMLSILLV